MAKLESAIQRDVKRTLQRLGWLVEPFTCNAYQVGIPDLYAFKRVDDEEIHRWIDVKRPKGSTLTKHQARKWAVWEGIELGVWVLTGAEADPESVLFGPPNWRDWWKPRYEKYLLKSPADILRDTK